MSGNESESTGGLETTASPYFSAEDRDFVRSSVFQTINAFLLLISLWILGCMIMYGTKTRRWRARPGSSSLNTGAVYITCTVVVGLSIPQIVTNVLIALPLPPDKDGAAWCELLTDLTSAFYGLFSYGSYFFLWILQRRIYTHPYVKERISKAADWFSRLVIVFMTALSVAMLFMYVFPVSYTYKETTLGCQYEESEQNFMTYGSRDAILVSFFVLVATAMSITCIYPAIRVALGTAKDTSTRRRRSCLWWIFCFIGKSDEYSVSPIQMAVRRAVISGIFIVIFHAIPSIIVGFVLPYDVPVVTEWVVYNSVSPIIILCMLGTFSFSTRILTSCFPTSLTKTAQRLTRKREKFQGDGA